MNRRKQKNKIYTILFLIIVIFVFGIAAVYTFFLKNQYKQYAYNAMEQNTKNVTNQIDTYLDSAASSIQLTSQLLTKTMSDRVLENASEVLYPLLEQTPFDYIDYIEWDDKKNTDRTENVKKSEYYKEGMKGNSGIWVDYNLKYSQENRLNFYTPLYFDEDIVGVLSGRMGVSKNLLPLLKCTFLGKEMIGILCDAKGHVISSTLNMDGDLYLENILNNLEVSEKERPVFYNHIENENEKIFEFDGIKKGQYIACVNTNKRTGWKIIQIVKASSFHYIIEKNIITNYFIWGLIYVFLLVVLLYFRKDFKKKQDILKEESNKVVQEYEQILTATASDTYKGIRRIDLETGFSEYLYFENNQIYHLEIGDWSSWLDSQKRYVHIDDYGKIQSLFCLENLRQMKEGVTYVENYRSSMENEDGYLKTYMTTASIIYIGKKKTAILTTIDNTAAVVNEMKQKKLLVSAASIYILMQVLDLKNDIIETLNSVEYTISVVGNKSKNVKEILQKMMNKYTDEKYLDSMIQFIDLDTLDERMKFVNTITLEFLSTKSGWCRARFIAVEYDENHHLIRVLWVVENIDTEKKKENKLLYLSETDLMTGIRNRGSGEKKIKELLENNHQGMFCLLDADKFKSINDNYGHGIGDKVIIEIANCLKDTFKNSDIVMRLGGDEYAVFADGVIDRNTAVELIHNFFHALSMINIPELGERKITVSVGVAFKMEGDGIDFEKLYHNADVCTYKSKKINGSSYTFYNLE